MANRYKVQFKSGSEALQSCIVSADSKAEARMKFRSSHSSKAQIVDLCDA
ncbi:MAG: hypothetical protein ACTTKH_01075 [Treponema sp.]